MDTQRLPESGVPWGLMERLGENTLAAEELEAIVPMLLREAVAPPAWFIARAARIPQQQAGPRRPGVLSRLLAKLVFDTRAAPLAVQLRGYEDRTRRLAYAAGPMTVHLELRQGNGTAAVVAGQALTEGARPSYQVELYRLGAATPAASSAANEFGYFEVPAPGPAVYTLVIHSDDLELTIPDLAIGSGDEFSAG